MKRQTKLVIINMLLCLFLISLANLAMAQKVNFSGSYWINKQKTEFGQAPQSVLPVKLEIKQEKAQITIKRTTVNDQQQESGYTETLSFTGADNEVKLPSGSTRKASLKWQDDQHFILKSQAVTSDSNPGLAATENWSLTDNGKTLVIDRSVQQPNGLNYTIKAYYDSQ
jgi:hypothetical protein